MDPLPVLSRMKGKNGLEPAPGKEGENPSAVEGSAGSAEKSGVGYPNAAGHDAVENLFKKAPPPAAPGSAPAKPVRPSATAQPEVNR
jgi:hypothetical protein